MDQITWGDFEQVELRVGTIVAVEEFPEARKPAYGITADFGPKIGLIVPSRLCRKAKFGGECRDDMRQTGRLASRIP